MLVLCFGVQTSLVYSDWRSVPLSEAALSGRGLWHEYACQTCHQLYGQGGFLGPDLTNVAGRLDSTRLASLLKVGSGQMPAFAFSDIDVAAMAAFLGEIDRPEIGRGQLRLGSDGEGGLSEAFDRAVEAALAEYGAGEAAAGFAAWRARPCAACHLPFRESPVGAPDISMVSGSMDRDSLDHVLASGRPEKGMPPPVPPLGPGERAAMIAFLDFLAANREGLRESASELAPRRKLDWGALPWWEYR